MNIYKVIPTKEKFLSWTMPTRVGFIAAWITVVFSLFSIFSYFFPFRYWDNRDEYNQSLIEAHSESESVLRDYVSAIIEIEDRFHEKPLTQKDLSEILDNLYVKNLPKIRNFAFHHSSNKEYISFVWNTADLSRSDTWQRYKYGNNEIKRNILKEEIKIFYKFRKFHYKFLDKMNN